jgi:RNA polymerase sigma factor (TIGR02999 family)
MQRFAETLAPTYSSVGRPAMMNRDVTQILTAIERGDAQASEDLLPLVYDELRRLAELRLAQEPSGQTLQPTALVHEAYLQLVGDGQTPRQWESLGHFFGAAADAMRRILIDNARRKKSLKRGGHRRRLDLELGELAGTTAADELLALDEALQQLAEVDARAARLVSLRYYAGLTLEEAARALEISPTTAKRDWAYARGWLNLKLAESD